MKVLLRHSLPLAFLFTSSGCGMLLNLLGKPKVEAVRPHIEEIGWESVALKLDVRVRNRWPFAIRAPLARWRVEIQGREFCRSEAAMNVALPARGVGTLHVPVRISYPAMWSAYRDLREASEVEYCFRGALATSVLGIPVKLPLVYSDKFPVLRPPRFTNIRFRIGEATLTRATLIIEATVTNPNTFEIDIQGLGYEFKAGEVHLGDLKASTSGAIKPGGTGQLTVLGEVSAARTAFQLLKGDRLDKPTLVPTGTLKTPHGTVKLDRAEEK
ncbi:MAG: LEA type 2 family protein [Planctomycetes bacterium]|nr:LEA type 2 family protein [Planctomycetota bacterium]